MKKIIATIFWLIVALLLLSQLIPKNNNNTGSAEGPSAINSVYEIPEQVSTILKTSCYDCHSNHTVYPWYSNIQPLSWWLNDHVKEGKKELNFSEFGNYSAKKQDHKLKEIAEQVEEQEMPLGSYTLIHQNAKLSSEQSALIVNWVMNLRSSINKDMPVEKTEHE